MQDECEKDPVAPEIVQKAGNSSFKYSGVSLSHLFLCMSFCVYLFLYTHTHSQENCFLNIFNLIIMKIQHIEICETETIVLREKIGALKLI